ncbi:MAG: vanadium-dependent haloperoxidase [Gemmatimonadaceae bacterium]
MVSEWVRTIYGAVRAERLSPPVASRVMVYSSAALYEGFAAVDPGLVSTAGVLNGLGPLPRADRPREHDGPLTALAAERVVMDSLFREGLPTTRAAMARLADSLGAARVALGISDEVEKRSEDLGRRIGLAIVAWSHGDGFDSTRGRMFQVPRGLAHWVNDAPATVYATQNISGANQFVALKNPANVLQSGNSSDRGLILSRPKKPGAVLPAVNMAGMSEPYWGNHRPFLLTRWNECQAPDPPPYGADSSSVMYRQADEVRKYRAALTPDQRTIAYYWADNAGESGTPVGHWLSIANQMASAKGLSAEDAARLMLVTSVAQADAFIAIWGYKYQRTLIRPRTYIRRVLDPAWEPLLPTPPFPEYPSGHSGISAAAAEVLTAVFGDGVAFHDSTGLTIGSAIRKFDSFREAAHEAGMSRLYGGIHFGSVGAWGRGSVGAWERGSVEALFSRAGSKSASE